MGKKIIYWGYIGKNTVFYFFTNHGVHLLYYLLNYLYKLMWHLFFSSPSISPSNSLSSTCSRESDEGLGTCVSSGDRCLSTILRLDREHNMFGLSNIAIEKTSRRIRKEDSRPVFPQTAIIQICCDKGCCKHMVILNNTCIEWCRQLLVVFVQALWHKGLNIAHQYNIYV